jgi:hypothetical protein
MENYKVKVLSIVILVLIIILSTIFIHSYNESKKYTHFCINKNHELRLYNCKSLSDTMKTCYTKNSFFKGRKVCRTGWISIGN